MSSPPPPKRPRRESGLMRPHGSSFVGSASGIHFVQTVYNAVSKAGFPSQAVPGEDDQLPITGPEAMLWRPDEFEQRHNELQMQDLLCWSQSYFDNWHPTFPFLHAPTVIDWLSTISNKPAPAAMKELSSLQVAIIRSVMSISLADSRQSGQHFKIPEPLVFHSYEEAIKSVQPVLSGQPSVQSLQAAMSIQLFLVSMLRLNGASRIQGIVIRLVFQMGLHRCSRRFKTFTTLDCLIRQRLFWSAYVIDRCLSQCLGLPITLRDDDIDVCHLNDEHHQPDVEQELDVEEEMDDRLALLSFIAKQSKLKGQVIELCNKSLPNRPTDVESFHELNTRVTKWANEVDEYLDGSQDRKTPVSQNQQSTLRLLGHELILSLNRPHLTASKSSSEYRSALQICISASRSIILELHRHSIKDQNASRPSDISKSVSDFLHWPFLTWSVWMSAFLILYAAVEKEVSRPAAVRLSEQCIDILKYLATRGSVWPSACATAIQDLFSRFRDPAKSAASPSTSGRIHQNRVQNKSAGTSRTKKSQPRRKVSERSQIDQATPSTQHSALHDWEQNSALTEPSFTFDPSLNDLSSGSAFAQAIIPSSFSVGQNDVNLFESFDIPFWIDDDQYASLMDSLDSI